MIHGQNPHTQQRRVGHPTSSESPAWHSAPSTGPHGGKRGWQDSYACTTSVLRSFLRGAYTDGDSPVCVRFGRIGVALRLPRMRWTALRGKQRQ